MSHAQRQDLEKQLKFQWILDFVLIMFEEYIIGSLAIENFKG